MLLGSYFSRVDEKRQIMLSLNVTVFSRNCRPSQIMTTERVVIGVFWRYSVRTSVGLPHILIEVKLLSSLLPGKCQDRKSILKDTFAMI
jgi:hypothetical protein